MNVEPLTPRETFPLEALPPWARAYVEQVAYVMQVDPTLAALVLLGAAGIALQGKAELHVRGEWVEPLSFWLLAALRSGNRKSPTLAKMMRPLRDYQRDANRARARYRRRLQECIDAIPEKAPGRKARERALKEAMPPDLKLMVSDATPEAVALELATQNECSAVVTDEPTSIAAIMQGLYTDTKSANTGIFMAAYSGSPYARTRVKTANADLERPALSLVLLGQPRVFEEITGAENLIELGFVGRLVTARPKDRLGDRESHDDAIEPAVADAYGQNMRLLLEATPAERLPDVERLGIPEEPEPWPTGPLERRRLHLTPDARELHRETEARIEPLLREDAALGSLSDFGGKLSGTIARTAALLHALDHPETWWREPVGTDPMGRAVEVGRYALGQVLAAFGERGKRQAEERIADHVLAKARKLSANGAGGVVTWKALCRALVQSNGRGKIRGREDLEAVVELLEEREDLVRDHTATRGRRWLVRREEGDGGEGRYASREEARA